jgi:ankyrin repeat protein
MYDSTSENAWMRYYQLLKQGVDPHPELVNEVQSLRGRMGQTVLHWLSLEAEVEIIERAIQSGLQLDMQDDLGNTALMEAAVAGRTDVMAALVSAGASLSIVNFDGEDVADYMDLYGLSLPDEYRQEDPT